MSRILVIEDDQLLMEDFVLTFRMEDMRPYGV